MVKIDVKDRYRRTVGIISTTDSININLQLVESGLAWHYKMLDKAQELAQAETKFNKIFLNQNIN